MAFAGRIISIVVIGSGLLFSGLGSATASKGVRTGNRQDWLQGWPMSGHDPQRTSRSSTIGPLHPHLLFSLKHFFLGLIGSNGRLYGVVVAGKSVRGGALDPQGRLLINYPTSFSPQALLPSDILVAGAPDDGQLHAFEAGGKPLWADQHVGLFKGATPLTTADDRLFAPFVGHPEDMTAGLDIVSASGKIVSRIEPGVSLSAVALSVTGTIYVVAQDSDSKLLRLEAFNPRGERLWQHSLGNLLPYTAGGCNCPVVGTDGSVYVTNSKVLYAYRADGTRSWRYRIVGGALALAQRADGVLLVYGRRNLDALAPNRKRVWRFNLDKRHVNQNDGQVIVDGAGTAYVGIGSSGSVKVISKAGKTLATLKTGRDHFHSSPFLELSPTGQLLVSGPNGTLRVYD